MPDYPKNPAFKKKFGPRGVLHCLADGKGGQTIEDTGPLTKKRMETIDDEVTERALDVHRQGSQGREAVLCLVQHRGHALPDPLRQEARGQERPGVLQRCHGRPRREHRPGCSTSSTSWASPTTPSSCTRPTTVLITTPGLMAGSPRSGRRRTPTGKAAGAFRLSCAGPARSRPGTVLNGIVTHQDWLPTLLAAAGEPDIKEKLLEGPQGRSQDLQSPYRWLQHAPVPDRRGRRKARGRPSSTSVMTERSWRSGTRTGRWS